MLAPELGSTNGDTNDKTPLVSHTTVWNKIKGFLNKTEVPNTTSGGYIEFGSMPDHSDSRTLGVFAGVFCPVTLSMFSSLIFLRVGYAVGNAGLLTTLLQFAIAYMILVFTVASICAISTNGAVEGGGAYFMISRTLGPEFGGSIGTLFFLANIVSSALNISGCVEGLVQNIGPYGYLVENLADGLIPDSRWYRFLYCSILNLVNLVICLIGAGMFAKTTVFILTTVAICIGITVVSFFVTHPMQVALPNSNTIIPMNGTRFGNFTGVSSYTFNENLWSNYTLDYTVTDGGLVSFASVFGVLFSGVTGIMAGANMSGELKNPGKAIPKGTLSAVCFTLVVYLSLSLFTAASCSRFLLQNNFLYMAGISMLPASVAVGLLTATWSAALSNVIGASRVLEALSKDNVFGSVLNFIPRGTWRKNPLAAVLVSCVLVQLVLVIGSLNVIAQLNSVLFLLSYLATNLACLGLELASAPNFRPSFKYFTWHTAFLGLMGTLIMMFVISVVYASCSILLCFILVVMLHLFSPSKQAQWGSISQALIFHQVRKYLLLLDSRKDHVKFWRPQVLLLVNNPRSACPVIDFVNDLKKGGLYVLGHVVKETNKKNVMDPTLELIPQWLNLVDHLKVKAFVEITVAANVRDGVQHLMRLSGMGAMKPNTIVFGFLDNQESEDFLQNVESPYYNREIENDIFPLQQDNSLIVSEYVQMISDVLCMNKNICICRNFTYPNKNKEKRYIDVWPVNFFKPTVKDAFDTTSLFMMQLACIINMVSKWSKLRLRICICDDAQQNSFSIGSSSSSLESQSEKLSHLLKMLRISAKLFPVVDITVITELKVSNMSTHLQKMNQLIIQHSTETAITFLYLPIPPACDMESKDPAVQYIEMLDLVSKNLPHVIFVHGVSTVTSTTL